jgi:hypothetical protein
MPCKLFVKEFSSLFIHAHRSSLLSFSSHPPFFPFGIKSCSLTTNGYYYIERGCSIVSSLGSFVTRWFWLNFLFWENRMFHPHEIEKKSGSSLGFRIMWKYYNNTDIVHLHCAVVVDYEFFCDSQCLIISKGCVCCTLSSLFQRLICKGTNTHSPWVHSAHSVTSNSSALSEREQAQGHGHYWNKVLCKVELRQVSWGNSILIP